MPDVVSPTVRSRMMSGIRGKNTRPELFIRRALHARGLRYRLHSSGLPGRPDLVFPARRAVVFVHGCFWHGHDCPLFRLPSTRTDFWRDKIESNRARDHRVKSELAALGWRQLDIWECAIRGRGALEPDALLGRIESWIREGTSPAEIRGS